MSEPLFSQTACETTLTPNMDLLKANPVIQCLVEERVAVLEARMRSELSKGNSLNTRKKSGCYNITDTPCAPVHMRWPNESCPVGATRKRTPYDDLTLDQFVAGLLTDALETQNDELRKHMLGELLETVKLSENLSWPITRGAFAVAMHRIEDESITWVKASAIIFSLPGICTTLKSTLKHAASSHKTCKHAFKKKSLVLADWHT